jgi:hypothetical protein
MANRPDNKFFSRCILPVQCAQRVGENGRDFLKAIKVTPKNGLGHFKGGCMPRWIGLKSAQSRQGETGAPSKRADSPCARPYRSGVKCSMRAVQ